MVTWEDIQGHGDWVDLEEAWELEPIPMRPWVWNAHDHNKVVIASTLSIP